MLNTTLNNVLIAGLVNESIVDGPGFRYVVFTQGCPHRCEECHNPHTHDFNAGEQIDIDDLVDKIVINPLLKGLTLSGGEPFVQAKKLAILVKKVKQRKTNFDFFVYTGYTYEYLINNSNCQNGYLELLNEIDYLVDGLFIKEKKNALLLFRGSENQRIINVKESLKLNSVIITLDSVLLGG